MTIKTLFVLSTILHDSNFIYILNESVGEPSIGTENDANDMTFHIILIKRGVKPRAESVAKIASHFTASNVLLRSILNTKAVRHRLLGVLFLPNPIQSHLPRLYCLIPSKWRLSNNLIGLKPQGIGFPYGYDQRIYWYYL